MAEYTLVLDYALASDLNCDSYVDCLDLGIFADQWLCSKDCSADPNCADLVNNDLVDFEVFALVSVYWGT